MELAKMVRRLIRGLDALLRRYYHIYEFNNDPDCMLRLSLGVSAREFTLANGNHIQRGDPVGEVHFWNEHIPQIGDQGPDLVWAHQFQKRLEFSLKALAEHIVNNPDFEHVQVFLGDPPIGGANMARALQRGFQRWGFEFGPEVEEGGGWQRFADFWKHLYALGLIWAYNPRSLNSKDVRHIERLPVLLSKETLLHRYYETEQHERRPEPQV
jgi:hypothetical protein